MIIRIKRAVLDIIESLIRNIGGGIGRKIRYFYYKRRFKQCGKNVIIDIGVVIENPSSMIIGSNVWINSYTQIVAGRAGNIDNRILKIKINSKYEGEEGGLYIGNGVGIGSYNILHAYGGLYIGDNVTTSAGVKIYSFSHYYRDDLDPTRVTYANCMAYPSEISCIISPIVIENGVWIGVNSTIFGGTIGENSFVAANSVAIKDIEPNAYAFGQPAVKIKDRFKIS